MYAGPDAAKLNQVTLRQQEVACRIEEAEHRWLEIHTELEAIGET